MSSIYNHRQMVPTAAANRVHEYLDQIRHEYDQLSQEITFLKLQRDEFDQKTVAQQVQEMTLFQQNLMELERNQAKIKQQYEEEIMRLRREIEHLRAGGAGAAPAPPQPPPPQIGHHSSTLFGNIAPGSGPALPPHPTPTANDSQSQNMHHMHQHPPQLHPPPHQQQQQPPPPSGHQGQPHPNSQAQQPGYYHSQQQQQPPSQQQQQQMASQQAQMQPGYAKRPRVDSEHGYPSTSNTQHMSGLAQGYGGPSMAHSQGGPPPPPQQQQQQPGRPGSARSNNPSTSRLSQPPSAMPPQQSTQPSASSAVRRTPVDMDTEVTQGGMRREGSDWAIAFTNKIPKLLDVDLVHTLDHTSVVCCVNFSHDGKYLATGCNRTAQIYDVVTGQRISVLADDSALRKGDLYIRSVCFSPDGNFIATGAEDCQIRIWDLAAKQIRNVLQGHTQDIYSLDYSYDGRLIVSGSGDRTARIWDAETGRPIHTLVVEDQDSKDAGVTSVAFSPDGKYVAAGSLDRMVRVWDARTGEFIERFEGHRDSVYSVVFAPDNKHLVSGSLDKSIKMWELGRGTTATNKAASNACTTTFTGHKDFVLSVACSPCGNWVISGSKDRAVQFWDPVKTQKLFVLQGHKNSVISVAISPKGNLFATGSGDCRARIWSYDRVNPAAIISPNP